MKYRETMHDILIMILTLVGVTLLISFTYFLDELHRIEWRISVTAAKVEAIEARFGLIVEEKK